MTKKTTAAVAYFNNVDMDLVVSDLLNDSPLLQVLSAVACPGDTFKYTRRTAAPSVGFRAENDGITNSVATEEKVTLSLGIMDASFHVDKAVAQADARGWQHLMGEEATVHLQEAFFQVERQICMGTSAHATNGFTGLPQLTAMDQTGDSMVYSAGSQIRYAATSVYLIRTGEPDVQVIWGQDGEFTIGDLREVLVDGDASGQYWAYAHSIMARVGLKAGSNLSIARICNIGDTSSDGLTDDLISEGLALFPASRQPHYIVMNRRSRKQLQQSRTATNATGAPAPIPMDAFGIPIVCTDALANTEDILS
jgi:hypothetical protein